MKLNILLSTALAFTVIFTSCDKENSTTEPTPTVEKKSGNFTLHFDNKVGNADVVLNSTWYTNQNGDSFQLSMLNYYISNIVFTSKDGSKHTEAESYHLIEQSKDASHKFTISNVPPGDYSSITMVIGVDSLRNVSGAQTGALDPINGMFWSWNTGYIMAKMEGNSPKSPNGKIKYHVGGFKGDNNVLKTVTLEFPHHETINGNTIELHIKADISKWFYGTKQVAIADIYDIHMPGAAAKSIAGNYSQMFSIEHEH